MNAASRNVQLSPPVDAPAVASRPLPGWPAFGEEEIAAAEAVLRSGRVNYWTGDECRRFEAEFAEHCGCRHAVAVANGTVALELAFEALGIGPGDEVVVPSRTFVASASAASMRGAVPVFADVDPVSQNLTADTVEAVLTARTRAVVCVHLAGWPCDMDPLVELAARRGLVLVEDCAQAHGARYRGRPVGSLGHVAAYSFCQDKIMTTAGEGGMLLTDDEAVWKRAWAFKDHGKSYDAVHSAAHPPGYRWLHESIGTNWRMTEVQGAIGRVLLRKLAAQVEVRRRHAARLNDAFRGLPALRVTEPPAGVHHSYYKYYVFVRPERLRPGWDRDRIMAEVAAEGIPCFSGICSEIYRERAFDGIATRPARSLPVAEELGRTSLMLLVHPTLSDRHIDDVASVLTRVMHNATLGEEALR
jgi:dTDP-4-amino-4,6-dideoxygalactose transaminase